MKTLKNKFVLIDKEDEKAVIQTLRDKQLSGTADVVEQYEKALASYFQTDYAIACANGTIAIHLALLGLGIEQGDEVILPPTAPVMTALPILLAKAVPVFVDTPNEENFSFDIKDLENKITSKTKAIITVPMWGYPIEMDEVIRVANNHKIPVIEDCSQAHGTTYAGKYLGTFGDIGLWSTHDRKLITTGEGAFITTNNLTLYQKMQEIKSFGRVMRTTKELQPYLGQFGVLFGFNYKINALGAGLGISQLKKLAKRIAIRTNNAKLIRKGIASLAWATEIAIVPHGVPNYYALLVRIDPSFHTGEYVSKYLLERGIVSDTYEYGYKPLYEMPLFSQYDAHCPHAKRLTETIITLPTHEGLTKEDLAHMVATLQSVR